MDAVTFHGREYIKATSLALKYRYTPDYLGQLARAKKVDARLVGRAWYILEDSLLEHRDGKYKLAGVAEITDKKDNNKNLSRVAVEPYLKNKTARIVLGKNGSANSTTVSYEEDEGSLMPSVRKQTKPTRLNVHIADAEKLKITTENKKPVNFKAEELPEVALSGTLVIADITEPEEIPELPQQIPEIQVAPARKTLTVRPRRPVVASAMAQNKAKHTQPNVTPGQTMLRPATVRPASFTPANIPRAVPSTPAQPKSFMVPVLAVFGAIVVSFGLLATSLEISATATNYDSKLNVALANIFLLFR